MDIQLADAKCGSCGYPVVEIPVNDQMVGIPAADGFDWFVYCSNKGCQKHAGQGLFQEMPDWIVPETLASPAPL